MTDKPQTAYTLTPEVHLSIMSARVGDALTIELPDGARLTAPLVGRGVRNPTPGIPPAYTVVTVDLAVPTEGHYEDEIAAAIAKLTAPPDPHAVHRVTVTPIDPHDKDAYGDATSDLHTTVYMHGDRITAYRIQHPADCDRLPYGQRCALDRYADDNAPSEMENWPAESGEYTARYIVHQPMNGTDAREYIAFEPATHFGPGVIGELTTHKGNRENCSSPECADVVADQREERDEETRRVRILLDTVDRFIDRWADADDQARTDLWRDLSRAADPVGELFGARIEDLDHRCAQLPDGGLATKPHQGTAPTPMPRKLRHIFVPALLGAGLPLCQVAKWAGLTVDVLARHFPKVDATQVPPEVAAELVAWMQDGGLATKP